MRRPYHPTTLPYPLHKPSPTPNPRPPHMPDWMDTLATQAHRAGFAWQARRAAGRLRRSAHPTAAALAEALAAALGPEADAEAAGWAARIEALRTRLRADDAVVHFHDHGVPHRLAGEAAPRPVARTVQDVCRASAPPHQGRLLYHLVRRLAPARCLELGTCLGLSTAYLAAALPPGGSLTTIEGGAALAERAREHLAGLGLSNAEVVAGRFQDVLPGVLAQHGPFDFVFLDGHHDADATRGYVRQLRPHLAEGALLVLDDVAWSAGMRRAWRAVAAEAALSVDLLTLGLCVMALEAV